MNASTEAPLHVGTVSLIVHDLDTVAAYYEQVIGLHRLAGDAAAVTLGAGGRPLLELRREPQARTRSPREAGLFHTAFLLPSRADLGRWARHAAHGRLPIQGASDHLVSEAIYLGDPEGNGIEIYADRPASTWRRVDGQIAMATEALDTEALMRAGEGEAWRGAPDGTVVGHIHLQVGSIAPAEAFYGDALGLDLTARYPGGSFFSSGGYHHHVAANIWNSRNAAVRSEPTTGLASFELVARNAATRDAVAERLTAADVTHTADGDALSLHDPWGTALTITTREG